MTRQHPIVRAEKAVMEGTAGQTLGNIFDACARGELITPNHIAAAQPFSNALRNVYFRRVMNYTSIDTRTVGDMLTEDSSVTHFSVHARPLEETSYPDFAFEAARLFVTPNHIEFYARPFPVIWRMDHIESRYKQRAGERFEYSGGLRETLPLLVMMQQVMEEHVNWPKTKSMPFAAPLDDGLCLGLAMPAVPKATYNRIYRTAFRDADELVDYPYIIQPRTSMHVYTYIGPREMSAAQARLHWVMSSHFLQGDNLNTLVKGMDLYNSTTFEPSPEYIKEKEADLKAHNDLKAALGRFMQSKLWRGTVSAPGTVRQPGGISFRR